MPIAIHWILAFVFAAAAVVFALGKGASLVSGHTAEDDENTELYDEKKLCRVSAVINAALAALFLESALTAHTMRLWPLLGAVFLICCTGVVLCSTVCALPQRTPWYARSAGMLFLGICVALLVLLPLYGQSGGIDVQLRDDSVTVSTAFSTPQTVEYAAVAEISYVPQMEDGRRLRGLAGNRLTAARFTNEKLGEYMLFAYTACPARIVLTAHDGSTLALNAPTAQQTEQLYAQLSERIHTYDTE